MKNKNTGYAILVVAVLIGGAIIFTNKGNPSNTELVSNNSNVQLNNGMQIISIDAKGGYWPKKIAAKAGVPTTIRFITNNKID